MYDWFNKDNVEIARNLVLIVGVPVGIFLGLWRSKIASTQSKTGQSQLILAEKGQRNDRYQKAAAMLGSELMSEREAGIFSLSNLAREDMENFYFIVQKILCQFVRQTTQQQNRVWGEKNENEAGGGEKYPKPAEDVKTAISELASINEERCRLSIEVPETEGISARIDLSYVCLREFDFSKLNLTRFDFSGAILSGSCFRLCVLNDVIFDDSNCSKTKFLGSFYHGPDKQHLMPIVPLEDASFQMTVLHFAVFEDGILHRSNFNCAEMYRTRIENCDLLDADFSQIMAHESNKTILFCRVKSKVGVKISSTLLGACVVDDDGDWLREVEAKQEAAEEAVAKDIPGFLPKQ